jgi:hypothetical protein
MWAVSISKKTSPFLDFAELGFEQDPKPVAYYQYVYAIVSSQCRTTLSSMKWMDGESRLFVRSVKIDGFFFLIFRDERENETNVQHSTTMMSTISFSLKTSAVMSTIAFFLGDSSYHMAFATTSCTSCTRKAQSTNRTIQRRYHHHHQYYNTHLKSAAILGNGSWD